MTKNTLNNVGIAYQWLNSYYSEVAQFCRRVRSEFESNNYESYTKEDAIEFRSSKSLAQPDYWLPSYHYQFFEAPFAERPGLEVTGLIALLCVGIDHFDPFDLERAEPVLYLARFGPVEPDNLAQTKGEIVYGWDVTDRNMPTWKDGIFRKRLPYTYCTRPLSTIETLDDVAPKIVQPLIAHDRERGGAQALLE